MKKTSNSFELTINLAQPNTLRSLFPKEKHEHVSLSLSGKMGIDDVIFLKGDVYKEDIEDEDTGEVCSIYINPYWNSIELKISDIIISCKAFNELSAYGLDNLIISNVQIECDEPNCIIDWELGHPFTSNKYESVRSIHILNNARFLRAISFDYFHNLKEYIVEDNSFYILIDGVLFSRDKLTLVSMPPDLRKENYSIPEGTMVIADNAFRGCHYLKSVSIPKSVVKIDTDAFEKCENLEKFVVHPDNNSYFSKKDVLYKYDYAWHRSDYPETINCLLRFPQAKKLTSGRVSIHNYTTQAIASHAFSGCKYIIELNIHINYRNNIDLLFYNIPNLRILSISSEKVPEIQDCNNLEILEIDGIEYISHSCFSYISSIKEYKVNNDRFHTIDGVIFNNHDELCLYPPMKEDKVYIVPKDTTAIAKSAFYCAFYLEELIVPYNIGIIMFSGKLKPYHQCNEEEINFTNYYGKKVKITITG